MEQYAHGQLVSFIWNIANDCLVDIYDVGDYRKVILPMLISRFVDPAINLSNNPVLYEDGTVKLPALDNHSMGTVFKEIIRRFNESTNVTDAGRHFTPRDVVELMAELAIAPVSDEIKDTTCRIYEIITSSLIQFKVSSVVEEKGCAKLKRGVQRVAACVCQVKSLALGPRKVVHLHP